MNFDFEHKKFVDKKLIKRMYMFVSILFVMTGILMYDIIISEINAGLILLGVALGLLVGFIVGRIFTIEWHTESKKVVSRLDIVGTIFLVAYIALSIFRNWIFAHWFRGITLSAFTFSFIEGVMIGRIMSLRFYINKVLAEQRKIKTK